MSLGICVTLALVESFVALALGLAALVPPKYEQGECDSRDAVLAQVAVAVAVLAVANAILALVAAGGG